MSAPPCPRCGEPMERDEIDVGIGSVAGGPYGCPVCFYIEPPGAEGQLIDVGARARLSEHGGVDD